MDLINLGKQPISATSAVGVDVRDTEQFNAIQDEYAKLNNPSATTPPDAALIVRSASELLGTQGKDLMVAAYLANGLMRQNGLSGLTQGMTILGDLIETYWEPMFPALSRLRARRNSIQWLIDQTSKHLESTTFEPQSSQICTDLKTQIKRIDDLLNALDDESPALFRLIGLVDAIPVQQEAPTPAPAVAEVQASSAPHDVSQPLQVADAGSPKTQAPPTEMPPALQLPTVSPLEVTSSEEAVKALHICNRNLNDIASALLLTDVANPLPYRLVRISAWAELFELPPHVNYQTRIPAPMSQIRDMIATAVGSQSWSNLVQICESNISTAMFWLDLHRLSEQALAKIGSSCDSARSEITRQVEWLIQQFPDLPLLSFSDGTPFADEETRSWMLTLAAAVQASNNQSNITATDGGLKSALANAQSLIKNNQPAKAIEALGAYIKGSDSERIKLHGRIHLCELVLDLQPITNAVPFAEPILATLEQHRLAQWDPEIAADALRVVYRAYARGSEYQAEAKSTLNRLAALNPAMAFQLSQAAG